MDRIICSSASRLIPPSILTLTGAGAPSSGRAANYALSAAMTTAPLRLPRRAKSSPACTCSRASEPNCSEKRYFPSRFTTEPSLLYRAHGHLSSRKHLITDRVCLWILDEGSLRHKRGMLNQRSEQDASASNKDGGIGTLIHLKLTQLVQNIFCVQLSRIANRLFCLLRQYRFLPLQHCTDMLVFNAHVVLRADFANDIIVHGDDSAL